MNVFRCIVKTKQSMAAPQAPQGAVLNKIIGIVVTIVLLMLVFQWSSSQCNKRKEDGKDETAMCKVTGGVGNAVKGLGKILDSTWAWAVAGAIGLMTGLSGCLR